MRVQHKDAKMSAGGITRNFWITDEIAPDSERFNWDTYRWENVESTTSQKYFIQNLSGLGPGDHVNLYINSMGGSVKEALGIHSELKRCPATVTPTLTDSPPAPLPSLLWLPPRWLCPGTPL